MKSGPKVKSGFAKVVFSRSFLTLVLAIAQMVVLVILVYNLAPAGSWLYTVLTIVAVIVFIFVFEKDDLNPAYKLMWLLIIVLLPLTGALLYIVWGHRNVPRKLRRQMNAIELKIDATLRQNEDVLQQLTAVDDRHYHCARYLIDYAHSPVYPGSGQEEYYPIGQDFFPRFLDAIRGAKKYIFMEYYILEPGLMLDTTLDILRQKAAEGVDVRLVWDGFGSMFTLPRGFMEDLRASGISCQVFSPLYLRLFVQGYAMLNHRDHRKITIVDGEVGFSGGLNFADEYINEKVRFGEWKDTAFLIRGEAVYSLTTIFLRTWDFVTGRTSDYAAFRADVLRNLPPSHARQSGAQHRVESGGCGSAIGGTEGDDSNGVQDAALPTFEARGFIQPYWDSPLDGENISENAYLNIIRQARRYVYISTPYLILDNEMITGLTLAAKSGVDVRILTPGVPDKPTVYLVTQSYYRILLKEGVRIYQYTPGFNHAKMYVADDAVAVVGSANMDYRSLYLHFESCVAFYGGPVVPATKQDMLRSFEKAHEVTLEEVQTMPFFRRIAQIFARFFAPLL